MGNSNNICGGLCWKPPSSSTTMHEHPLSLHSFHPPIDSVSLCPLCTSFSLSLASFLGERTYKEWREERKRKEKEKKRKKATYRCRNSPRVPGVRLLVHYSIPIIYSNTLFLAWHREMKRIPRSSNTYTHRLSVVYSW